MCKKWLILVCLICFAIAPVCQAGTWTWSSFTYNNDIWMRNYYNSGSGPVAQFDFRLGGGGCIAEIRDCQESYKALLSSSPLPIDTDRVVQLVLWGTDLHTPCENGCYCDDDGNGQRYNTNQSGNISNTFSEITNVDIIGNVIEVWAIQRDQWTPCYDDNYDSTITYMTRYTMDTAGILKIRRFIRLSTVWQSGIGNITTYDPYVEQWTPPKYSADTFTGLAMAINSSGTPTWYYDHTNVPIYPNWNAATQTNGYSVLYRLGAHTTNNAMGIVFGNKARLLYGFGGGVTSTHRLNLWTADNSWAVLPALTNYDMPAGGTMIDVSLYMILRQTLNSNVYTWVTSLNTDIPAPAIYASGYSLGGELATIRTTLTNMVSQTGTKTQHLAPLLP